MTWTPPPTSCVRRAWLTMGAASVALEDPASGYFCTSFDTGFPTIRAVTNNRPDQHGTDDRTALFGDRVITAAVTALVGAGARIDAIAGKFAPFMNPGARPVLHWILDRPGATERTLTVRASAFSGPIVGANQRDIHLSFIASDPFPRDPNINTATGWSGSGVPTGRTYPLTFPRVYPVGGSAGTVGTIVTNGDVAISPLLRIYGPVTTPVVTIVNSDGSGTYTVRFVAGYIISAGQYVDVDTARKTAYVMGDPTQPVMASIDWSSTTWPVINPTPNSASLALAGSSTSPITQVIATWQDVYLT